MQFLFITLLLFLICFLKFFFVKCFNNFFTVKIINNICTRNSIFNFFNHKLFFWPIWNIDFCKNIFIFWYSYMITNFKFRTFFIILFIKVNIYACLYINRLHFNVSVICIVYLLCHLIYQYNHILILISCIYKFCSLSF